MILSVPPPPRIHVIGSITCDYYMACHMTTINWVTDSVHFVTHCHFLISAFYKTTSINSPVPEPFLPQPRTCTPNTVTCPHMGTPNANGYFRSSRRSLTFDLGSETENNDSSTDFKIQKGFRRPSEIGIGVTKRLPLTDLPGQRTSTPHRNGVLMQQKEEEDDLEG